MTSLGGRWRERSTSAASRSRPPCSTIALAEEYGVVWQEDLFAPAGEDSRYTTNVDGFFGAQQAWMAANLPENGTILTLGEYGTPSLPKGAERVYGEPGKDDKIGHYIDGFSGEVETIAYRVPPPKKATKVSQDAGGNDGPGAADHPSDVVVKLRPDVTQKGLAMIGDFRTDALHRALEDENLPADTLVGLLVLALAGKNVSVETGGYSTADARRDP